MRAQGRTDGQAQVTRILISAVRLCAFASLTLASPLHAQRTDRAPEDGGQVYQLGMPPIWKGNAGATFGWYSPADSSLLTVLFHAGISKDLLSPIAGIAAIGLEGYAGYRGSGAFDGGARAMFSIPAFRLGVGADYNVPDNAVEALFRFELATRRGGIFGRGSMLRLDWIPARGNSVNLGVNVPLWGRNIGDTRPQRDAIELDQPHVERVPAPVAGGLDSALTDLRIRALWIARLATPLVEKGDEPGKAYVADLDTLRTRLALRGLAREQADWHEALDRAFTHALGRGARPSSGAGMAQGAREVLLENLLIPFNRLLGQRKAKDGLGLYAASAHARFARELALRVPGLSTERVLATEYLFQGLVDIAEAVRVFQEKRWEDSRLVWLPLQLALRESEYDSQEELNRVIERATGQVFTRGNQVGYVMNEDFQLEFARSVRDAQHYHVLWIHDFRGQNAEGKPDRLGFAQTAHVYLRALAERIRGYDTTGVIPQYFILLDQNYFEANKTRIWFRVLEDPLRQSVSFPKGFEQMASELAAAQAELRDAVASSRVLQSERRQYGDRWLRNRIQVHINVTNPSDFSFTSNHAAGIIPVPDNVIRDHRKIAFYDITEEDPTRGLAMYTGMGIGEHYAGANWEDRAVMVRGPSALTVKTAARRLLEQQGFTADEIPLPLRPQPFGPRYQALVDSVTRGLSSFAPGWTGEALELHNETGYATKAINVEKAILYSLMPAGSVIKVPDSLWQSWLYGSLLVGSALRGCKVLIIAPSLTSAPSSAGPTMARAHGLLSALLVYQNALAPELSRQGGVFRIGLYAPKAGVGDLAGRIRQVLEQSDDWRREVYPSNPAVRAELLRIDTTLTEGGDSIRYLVSTDSTERPKLHLKANFFVSAQLWTKLVARPEWGPVLREYFRYIARPEIRTTGVRLWRGISPGLVRNFYRLVSAADSALTPAEREQSLAFFTVGSTNMNYRSMYLDGEVQITMTGWNTMSGLVDFFILAGLCEWPETQAELDALLPPPGGLNRSMARLLRNLL